MGTLGPAPPGGWGGIHPADGYDASEAAAVDPPAGPGSDTDTRRGRRPARPRNLKPPRPTVGDSGPGRAGPIRSSELT